MPAEADLKDFPFTPIYRARLFGSSFHARATDAQWRAGVTLWLKSQDQTPAGSLPDDDIELCRLAELGRDQKTWRKLREGALHGWFKCADGRLYNKVVAQVVIDQWQGKLDRRNKTLKARVAALQKRLSQATEETERADILRQIQALSQPPVTDPVTNDVTGSKGQGQGQGQGKEEGSAPNGAAGVVVDLDPQKAVFERGKKVLGKSSGGQVTKLLRRVDGNCDRALDLLNLAAGKGDAGEYIAGFLRGNGEGRADDVLAETDRLYREWGIE